MSESRHLDPGLLLMAQPIRRSDAVGDEAREGAGGGKCSDEAAGGAPQSSAEKCRAWSNLGDCRLFVSELSGPRISSLRRVSDQSIRLSSISPAASIRPAARCGPRSWLRPVFAAGIDASMCCSDRRAGRPSTSTLIGCLANSRCNCATRRPSTFVWIMARNSSRKISTYGRTSKMWCWTSAGLKSRSTMLSRRRSMAGAGRMPQRILALELGRCTVKCKAWRRDYNEHLLRSSLGKQTPMERTFRQGTPAPTKREPVSYKDRI